MVIDEEKLEIRRYGFIYRAKMPFVDGSTLHKNEVWIDGELKKYKRVVGIDTRGKTELPAGAAGRLLF